MTPWSVEIVGQEDRLLPIGKTVGDAVRGLVRRRWKNNAAKMLERTWEVDPKTAKNIVGQGNVSERTLTKAIRAEGWAFLEALGHELTGETYADWLHRITEEQANEQKERERRRDAVAGLHARARELGDLLARQSP